MLLTIAEGQGDENAVAKGSASASIRQTLASLPGVIDSSGRTAAIGNTHGEYPVSAGKLWLRGGSGRQSAGLLLRVFEPA
ncbi:hypothetical protein C2U68_09335 [Methylomonas koyamae]|nr:hypothetical protein C2U68_09335 [Methylomonas koyamae]